MGLLLGLALVGLGFGLGSAFARNQERSLRPFNPVERKRLLALRRLVDRDPGVDDPAPRVELAEHFLLRGEAHAAVRELGAAVRRHPDQEEVRVVAREVLRAVLLHEGPERPALASGLLPQDIDWHPESKRIILRLRDLALGGILELRQLELHVDDFEPGRQMVLPRVVACRAVVREERLLFALGSRVDWDRSPLRDLSIRFRGGRIHIQGNCLVMGVPVGFRVAAAVRAAGAARLQISFPELPIVAGLVPLPIDLLVKRLAGVVEARRPGAVTSREQATLEVDLMAMGLPPVEVNLREVRIENGLLEVLCSGEGVGLELPELPERMADLLTVEDFSDGEEEEEEQAAPATGGGMLSTLGRLVSGADRSSARRAMERAHRQLDAGELNAACRTLSRAAEDMEADDPDGPELIEELAELELRTGHRDSRRRATERLEELLERRPGRARASCLLGRAESLSGRDQEAEQRLRMAVALDPFQVEPYRLLAELTAARGALGSAARASEIADLMEARPGLPGEPREMRGILQGQEIEGLVHPGESDAVGRLIRHLSGALGWLDPSEDLSRGDPSCRPAGEDDLPRLWNLASQVAESLQGSRPSLVLRRDGRGPLRSRGVSSPWVEVPELELNHMSEPVLRFELGRSLYHVRSGRGFLLGLQEPELELLFALLRAVGNEAVRAERGAREVPGGVVAQAMDDLVGAVEEGWVMAPEELDVWVPPEVREGARPLALAFADHDPTYREVERWRRSVESSGDRAGLLYSGSVSAALDGLALAGGPGAEALSRREWDEVSRAAREDPVAYRVHELLSFAVSPELEELERVVYS